MMSNYLNWIVCRLQRLMGEYNDHRKDMMTGEASGMPAIETALSMAEQIDTLLTEVAFYTAQGYEPAGPLPIDIVIGMTDRKLI